MKLVPKNEYFRKRGKQWGTEREFHMTATKKNARADEISKTDKRGEEWKNGGSSL